MAKEILYMPMRLTLWEGVRAVGIPFPVSGPGIGFIPVYKTEAEALEAYPAAFIVRISQETMAEK